MRAMQIVIVVLVLAALGAAGIYFLLPGHPPPPPGESAPAKAGGPSPPAGPHYPVAPTSEPLPPLASSDATMVEALRGLVGADAFAALLVPEGLIRNIVATVDNLPRDHFARRLSPLNPAGGLMKVAGANDKLTIAPANSARYSAFVAAFTRADPAAVVSLYQRLYPLFQQAYVELGYPNGYFNDRLIEAIDNLLAAPEPKGPVKLVVPHVLYEYADPELEEASSGQKTLIRMGAENEAKVKAKLREYRALLAASPTPR